MDLLEKLIDVLFLQIPNMVWLSICIVIVNTYVTSLIIDKLEEALEQDKGKEIKIFNYKKIWIAFIWTVLITFILLFTKHILIQDFLIYFFMIMGFSTFLYEAFLKKYMSKKDD